MEALTCLSILTNCTLSLQYPEVITPFGKVQGYYDKTSEGTTFSAFEGVPYARPPVGKYRFREPQPLRPWVETWHAKTLYRCIQYDHFSGKIGDYDVIGDEDCLYLNIYTPFENNFDSNALDVIVYIHGGAFMFNMGGGFHPRPLMNKNVVFVTFNYRLGPLGFLSTEDNVLPGNNGIRDQIMALKWIKENIQHFGGNPESITITGMSAGGASVHLHYMSPKSVGLFKRGISQSGSMYNAWVLAENSLEKAKKLARIVGCPTTTSREIIECLRFRPARQIVEAVKNFQAWLYNPFSPFGVVVDKWSQDPVLPDHPYRLIKQKKVQDLPWLTSHVAYEGLYPASEFISNNKYLEQIDTCWNEIMPHILDYNYTVTKAEQDEVSQKIRKFYLNDQKVTKDTFSKFVDIISDRIFVADIEKAARMQAAATKSPVYYYLFAYRGAHSKTEIKTGSNENYGTSHGDDTCYILDSVVNTKTTPEDREMSEILANIWLSFASKGKPEIKTISWPKVTKNPTQPLEYININSPSDITIASAQILGHRDFWDSLPINENKKLFSSKDEL